MSPDNGLLLKVKVTTTSYEEEYLIITNCIIHVSSQFRWKDKVLRLPIYESMCALLGDLCQVGAQGGATDDIHDPTSGVLQSSSPSGGGRLTHTTSKPHQIERKTEFLVVKGVPFACNGLLGMPTINAIRTVVSAHHLKIMFQTTTRVG